jgi:hypothetical protein
MQDLPLAKKKEPPIAALSLTDLCSVLSLRGGLPRAFWYVLKTGLPPPKDY